MSRDTSTAIVTGSLADVAEGSSGSLAESFVSADVIVIVDVSGSMSAKDTRGGESRYDRAIEELAALQSHNPGKIAVIAFSSTAMLCPGGLPPLLGSGTDLAGALRFAKMADGVGCRFIIVSDGEPDDQQGALGVAQGYQSRIDVVFVGDENYPRGREFLHKLAAATGGQGVTADRVHELAETVERLLLT